MNEGTTVKLEQRYEITAECLKDGTRDRRNEGTTERGNDRTIDTTSALFKNLFGWADPWVHRGNIIIKFAACDRIVSQNNAIVA